MKVGDAYYYYLMYGRIVNFDKDRIYFATPHGSLYNPTEELFNYSARPLADKADLERLAQFEQLALDEGKELYGGRIPEFTHEARNSRYGYGVSGGIVFDRKTEKHLYSRDDILSHLRSLEAKLEHIMSAVKDVAYSGDYGLCDDAMSKLIAAYEDVEMGNVGAAD